MFRGLITALAMALYAMFWYFCLLGFLFPPDSPLRSVGGGIFGPKIFPSFEQMALTCVVQQAGYFFFPLCVTVLVGTMVQARWPGGALFDPTRYLVVHTVAVTVVAILLVVVVTSTGYSHSIAGSQWSDHALWEVFHYGMLGTPLTHGVLFGYYQGRISGSDNGDGWFVEPAPGLVDDFVLWALGFRFVDHDQSSPALSPQSPEMDRDPSGRFRVGPS